MKSFVRYSPEREQVVLRAPPSPKRSSLSASNKSPQNPSTTASRGATLEDSYRHVLGFQAKDSTKLHLVPDIPVAEAVHSYLPTSDQYTSSMYYLSQSEPIYHDLEENRQALAPAVVSPLSSSNRASANRSLHHHGGSSLDGDDVDDANTARQNRSYEDRLQPFQPPRSCWPGGTEAANSFRRKAYQNLKTPLRSKRDDVTPILFGDPVDSSSVTTSLSQQDLLRKKARSESRSKKVDNKEYNYQSINRKTKDRILNMPAMFLGGARKATAKRTVKKERTNGIKVGDLITTNDRINKLKTAGRSSYSRTSNDSEISTTASTNIDAASALGAPPANSNVYDTSARNQVVEDETSDRNPVEPKLRGQSNPNIYQEIVNNEARNVRFSKKESFTLIFRDESESDRPFDEKDDLSVLAGDANCATAAVEPSPPSSCRSLQSNSSSSNGLKSCLRPARFSPAKSGIDRKSYSADDGGLEMNTSVSKSPPRGGSGFLERGIEVSPIRGGSSGVAFHDDMIDKVNRLYPDPSLDAGSTFSDPTLDLTSEYHTDEDSMLSNAGFINNVAAIVIQTAFRQYLAIKLASSLRQHNNEASSNDTASRTPNAPTPLRIKASNTENRSNSRSTSPEESSRSLDPTNDTSTSKSSSPAIMSRESQFETFEERLLDMAATKVQAVFRGFWVRDCLSVDHYCAKIIQQAFRAFICRMEYNFDLYRIMLVQSVWRRQIARNRVAHVLGCTILIQSVVRGYLQRKASQQFRVGGRSNKRPVKIVVQRRTLPFSEDKLKPIPILRATPANGLTLSVIRARQDAAATKIQAMWRRAFAETEFLKTLLDVLLVQTAVRRWFAIRKVKHMKSVKQRLKRRHRYVVAATKRRTAARAASKASTPRSLPSLDTSSHAMETRSTQTARPSAPFTPKGRTFKQPSYSVESNGSVTGSTSGGSEDEPNVLPSQSPIQKYRSLRNFTPRTQLPTSSKPPLPTSAPKEIAVVTPKSLSHGIQYIGDDSATSLASSSGFSDDDRQSRSSSPQPHQIPFAVEEDSTGGAKALLSLWRERDKRNSLAMGQHKVQ